MIGLRRGLVRGARISALGVHVPERVLTNEEISQFLDTSDEWILTRTGIRERRIARVDEAASDLGEVAARRCLEQGEGRALLSRAGDSSFRNFFWGRAFRRRQQQAPAVDRVSAFFS